MKLWDVLQDVSRLYIEAAPLIYYVEDHPQYARLMDEVLDGVDSFNLVMMSSVITLPEVLVQPIRRGQADLEQAYRDILVNSDAFQLIPISVEIAELSARLRAAYLLRTPDALHLAAAIRNGCDLFLSNDTRLNKVAEIRIAILDDFL